MLKPSWSNHHLSDDADTFTGDDEDDNDEDILQISGDKAEIDTPEKPVKRPREDASDGYQGFGSQSQNSSKRIQINGSSESIEKENEQPAPEL